LFVTATAKAYIFILENPEWLVVDLLFDLEQALTQALNSPGEKTPKVIADRYFVESRQLHSQSPRMATSFCEGRFESISRNY
jgi:hypothetical protein